MDMDMDFDSSNANALRKVFHGLHSDLQRAYHHCSSQQLTPVVKTVDTWRNLPLPTDMRKQLAQVQTGLPESTYFPHEIQHHILNEQSTAITYRFKVDDRKVVLHFVEFNKRESDLNMNKMLAHAKRVCALIHLVSMHASRSTCSAELNIFIYMTKFKKQFPTEKGQTLDAEHANTGMSYHCAKNNDVLVYRKEEWFKVLIHELFHALGLSFIESDMPPEVEAAMQRMLQRMYAISHPVRIYETYCEMWARILNIVFDCFSEDDATHADAMHMNVFIDCVFDGLHANARFAQKQCAKLLRYMDLSHAVISHPTKENRALVAKKYRENTNVFAYYVLTCVLLHSPDAFMVWCYKNNPFTRDKPRTNVLQFRTIPSNFNGFMEMMHRCKQRCPDLDSACNDADVLGSSMRMTVKDRF
jgi:hypothetical protein